jgi:hypothetical protein
MRRLVVPTCLSVRFGRAFHGNRRAVRRLLGILGAAALLAGGGAAHAAIEDNTGEPVACTEVGRSELTPGPAFKTDGNEVKLDGRTIVSPALVEASVTAGDRLACPIEIRNRHAERTTFDLGVSGLLGSRSSRASVRFVEAGDPDAVRTAASWVRPSQDEVTLEPRGVVTIQVLVTVPDEPVVGSTYATFDITPRTKASAGDTNIGVVSRVSVPFLFQVDGEGAAKLALHDAHAPKLRWSRDPWTLRAKLDNDGTLHATPNGRVRLRSLFGNTVANLEVAGRPILPGGRQAIEQTWDDVPWLGFYRYDLRVADGDEVARASGWFVALPPWWVLALAALLLAYVIASAIVRRRRARHWVADDTDDDEHDELGHELDDDLH